MGRDRLRKGQGKVAQADVTGAISDVTYKLPTGVLFRVASFGRPWSLCIRCRDGRGVASEIYISEATVERCSRGSAWFLIKLTRAAFLNLGHQPSLLVLKSVPIGAIKGFCYEQLMQHYSSVTSVPNCLTKV